MELEPREEFRQSASTRKRPTLMALKRPDSGWQPLIQRCVEGVLACAQTTRAADTSGLDTSHGEPGRLAFGEGDVARAMPSLSGYLDLVVKWNQRHDLTAARDVAELVDLFVADAAVLGVASTEVQDWVDIGTGAGAPGIPLRLLRPISSLTLVEPRSKRCAFLNSVLGALDLDDVRVLRVRSEAVPDHAHQVAVSRATFAPELWLEEGARLATSAVWVLLAKGETPSLPGWQAELEIAYRWPLTGVQRRALKMVPSADRAESE